MSAGAPAVGPTVTAAGAAAVGLTVTSDGTPALGRTMTSAGAPAAGPTVTAVHDAWVRSAPSGGRGVRGAVRLGGGAGLAECHRGDERERDHERAA